MSELVSYLAIAAVGWTILGSRYAYRKALGKYGICEEEEAMVVAIVAPAFWPLGYPLLLLVFVVWPALSWPGRYLARRAIRIMGYQSGFVAGKRSFVDTKPDQG